MPDLLTGAVEPPWSLHQRRVRAPDGTPEPTRAFLAYLDHAGELAAARSRLAQEEPALAAAVDAYGAGESLAALARAAGISRQSMHERKQRGLALLAAWLADVEQG